MESRLALPKRCRRSRSAEVGKVSGGSSAHCAEIESNLQLKLYDTIIIGGGIAGVSCAQELSRLSPSSEVTLVSQTAVLREVLFSNRLTENLEDVSVTESTIEELKSKFPNISVVIGSVSKLDNTKKILRLSDGDTVRYNNLCICTGAVPRLLCSSRDGIITIRDSDSVDRLSILLQTAKRAVLIGNGGIAMELAHELHYCETDWIIRDNYIGRPFFDATASEFVLDLERSGRNVDVMKGPRDEDSATAPPVNTGVDRMDNIKYGDNGPSKLERGILRSREIHGSALGPHLRRRLVMKDDVDVCKAGQKKPLHLHFEQEVYGIYDHSVGQWIDCSQGHGDDAGDAATTRSTLDLEVGQKHSHRFSVVTTAGTIVQGDCIIAAVGVVPNTNGLDSLAMDENGAILVNDAMQTSDPCVFAAGDCCNYSPAVADRLRNGNRPWFQMRLWAQARVMGVYAAQCINEKANSLLAPWNSRLSGFGGRLKEHQQFLDDSCNDWAFHLFAHVTHFFGKKVVLLGRFNGQGLRELEEAAIRRVLVSENSLKDSGAKAASRRSTNSPAGQGGEAVQPKSLIDFTSSSKKRGRICVCCDGTEDYVAKHGPDTLSNGVGEAKGGVEIAVRVTPGLEYIKVVMRAGKVEGALLIGETDLEETFENLILNRIDVSHLSGSLLDPDHDLEDYFD